MTELFTKHEGTLTRAREAVRERVYWSAFSEVPSTKVYGESAKSEGLAAFEARLRRPFCLPGHPVEGPVGSETSPFGPRLGITYPRCSVEELIKASRAAAGAWGAASPEARVGICLEILSRLNRMSFEIANAVMHTTGQAFAMAFQAGGPHAQDRGLEAVAIAYAEMSRIPASALWSKPQGKGPAIVLEKHWKILPRGISLVIGCNTFPTWNSYPGLFASLATGNTILVKPHPSAILPLAITVEVARQVLAEEDFNPDIVLLAADEAGAELTQDLVKHPAVSIIDYTGSQAFAEWVRSNARGAEVYTEEAGVNSIVVSATHDFSGMCANIAFSLSLYSGQMCTAPQNIFLPENGIMTEGGHRSFEEVCSAIAAAVDELLADPAHAAAICGAIANGATLKRIEQARSVGRIVRDSSPLEDGNCARTATPLIVAVDQTQIDAYGQERFGPVAIIVKVADADEGIRVATTLALRKGAITAALYETDERRIHSAANSFCSAGVNLSVNLTGSIFVNQSAAFSDFHVTGANPAGSASLTDTAFVANRFRRAMWRRPVAA